MEIIVIGAGISGLTAAVTLGGLDAKVLVLEANSRIGGRVHSLRDPENSTVLGDLGPSWVWPKYQPVAARWIAALGVETFDQYNEGDAVILGYGPEPVRQPLPGQDGMMRLVGGPSAFVDALVQRLDPTTLRTSAPVVGIVADGANRVRVLLDTGEEISADKVIVSVPLRCAAEAVDMPWAVPSLITAMKRTPTWMSTHAKVVALYDRPFWREAGLAGRIASRTGPLVEAHDHSGSNGQPSAIFGFVGWPAETRRSHPERLRQAILEQLSQCFGPDARHPIELVIQDWAENRFIASQMDMTHPPHHPEVGADILRDPHFDGRVRFAVSEVSHVSPGLIEGAFAAGEAAALKTVSGER